MSPEETIWYRIGLAYERARLAGRADGAAEKKKGSGTAIAKRDKPPAKRGDDLPIHFPDADELLGAAIWLALDRVLGRVGRRRRPGVLRIVWAGAAGAGAALLADLVRPLLVSEPGRPVVDEGTVERMIAGLAQGLVYGAVVEPRVPGPALLKGAVYGSVEFATDPAGGLSHLLSSHTPQGRIPLLGDLFDGRELHERTLLEHLVFGIALALLYESSSSSRGTLPVPADE